MFRCPKCGTDNMLTAIFCRGCGERLNLDEIRPDDFQNIGQKQDNTMQNIIGGAIIGAAALIFLIGWMFPAGGMIKTTPDQQNEWKNRTEKLSKEAPLEMTDQEATAFLNAYTGEEIPCTVHFLANGKAKAVFPTKLWGMPVRVTIIHTLSASNGVSVTPESYKVGLFPLMEKMKQEPPVVGIWNTYSSAWGKMRNGKKIADATVEKGKITIRR